MDATKYFSGKKDVNPTGTEDTAIDLVSCADKNDFRGPPLSQKNKVLWLLLRFQAGVSPLRLGKDLSVFPGFSRDQASVLSCHDSSLPYQLISYESPYGAIIIYIYLFS